MNQRLHLLNRRRKNILEARHVRAVSLRHVPYHFGSMPKKNIEKENDVEVINEVKVEQEVKKQPENTRKIEKEAKKAEKKAEKEKKKEKKLLRKQQKIQDKEDLLNRLIDEPEHNLFFLLKDPIRCIDNNARVDYAVLSTGTRVVWNTIKWIAISACIAICIAGFINANPFGFARLNFTSTSVLAAKLMVFGYLAEIVTGFGIACISKTRKESFDRARMVSLCTLATPCKILMFTISAICIHYVSEVGIALFAASCVLSLLMTGFSLFKANVSPRRTMLVIFLVVFASTYLIGPYFSMFAEDILHIFQNIMNI